MRVLQVSAEIFPLLKTGGLADVAGALPGALAGEGIVLTTLLPGYPAVLNGLAAGKPLHKWPSLLGVHESRQTAKHKRAAERKQARHVVQGLRHAQCEERSHGLTRWSLRARVSA